MTDPTPFETSTLADYGDLLPIGVLEGKPAQLAKGFAFKPFLTRDEREIDTLRRKNGDHPGRDVVSVLSHMLTAWGDDDAFAGKSAKLKKLAISQAFMADVLYAFIKLRIEALGSVYGLSMTCASCEHEHEWKTDLNGMELTVARSVENLSREFTLRHPITFGDKTYDTAVLRPPTWGAVLGINTSKRRSGVADIKLSMVKDSITGLRSSEHPEQPHVHAGLLMLDELSKLDLERLARTADTAFPSLDTKLEVECPACGNVAGHNLQWSFPFFFGASSLPEEM